MIRFKLLIQLMVIGGLIVLACLMVATFGLQHHRIVTVQEWTGQVSLITFETRYWHYRSWSEIRSDLSDRHELNVMAESVGWKGVLWVRGQGQPLTRGSREYQIGKDTWPVRWGEYCVPAAFQGFVLDEASRISYSKMDKNLSAGEVEEELAIAVYEETRRASTVFVKTNAVAVQVVSWEDFLHKASAGNVKVAWGEEYFREGSLVRMHAPLLPARESEDKTLCIDLAGYVLPVHLEHAYRDDVDAMGRTAEVAGASYDVWGYFITPSNGDPPERAHFEAVLIAPSELQSPRQ
ncbi:MAG: hypothetical protein WCN95_02190 [bacterium]